VDVDGRRIRARRIVIATGSAPAVPAVSGLGDVAYLTNETVFGLTELPSPLAVLGGGPIGCVMAQAFRSLGAEVTVIEALDRLLPREEPEASAVIGQGRLPPHGRDGPRDRWTTRHAALSSLLPDRAAASATPAAGAFLVRPSWPAAPGR
jgi:hypothetical protein